MYVYLAMAQVYMHYTNSKGIIVMHSSKNCMQVIHVDYIYATVHQFK